MKPNATCDDKFCRIRQTEQLGKPKILDKQIVEKKLDSDQIIHENNDWGKFFLFSKGFVKVFFLNTL